ncbi:MAG TPA: ATP-binding cassette domain-containing protein, partial [Methylomirabilota bacterium]|nr:ATP-binding cassette domain-containing protein [Methylomirabilota bacterium]
MLTVRGLDVFHGRVQALRGVDVEVRRGELVTLVGPNGAGKTTLLRALTGLLPARGGEMSLDGVPFTGAAPEAIVRRGIGMVPEGRELFGPLSVRHNLVLGAYATPRRERRLADGLERVLTLFPALRPRLGQAAL